MIIFLVLAVWGVVADRKYLKAGGNRTTRLEMFLWSVPPVGFVAYMILLMLTADASRVDWGMVAHGIGQMTGTTLPAYLCLYEARRWYVRYKHPLINATRASESP